LEIFADLLVLLVLTRLLGELAERLGQPATVGELCAGVLLATLAAWFAPQLPYLERLATSEHLATIVEVAIFFLVLLAGVELQPGEIARSSPRALAVALGGMLVPLVAGAGLAWLFLPESELKQGQVLLVGVALSISAIPATVKIFADLNLLHTPVGQTVVTAAIFDDVFGLILLAILVAVIQTGQVPDLPALGLLLVKVAGFFAITVTLGVHVYPRVRRGLKLMQATAMEFSALVVVALAYGLLAELLNMHWVLGAFTAGLFFEKSRVGIRAYSEMRVILTALAGGFLGPLFFAAIGLRVDLTAIAEVPFFLVLLIVTAFLGKLVGAGLPALWTGLGRPEALAVGAGMGARGAIEMVVISIAYEAGLFVLPEQTAPVVAHLYSALILVAVSTTLLTPILLRRIAPAIRPPPGS